MADAPGIRRGRVFIRRLGRTSGPWRGDATRQSGCGYGMVGVVEIDDETPWKRERAHGFSCLVSDFGGTLSFSGKDTGPSCDQDLSCSEIDSFLTSMDFPRAGAVHEALGWGAGGMVLRDTRGPSSPGTTLAVIAIGLCLPEYALPDAHMASFVVGGDDVPNVAKLKVEGPCRLATNGTQLSQIHRMPLWGWDDERFGFSSTLRLDVIDKCTRLEAMMIEGTASIEELTRLQREVHMAVQDNTDPIFARYRRLAAAQGMVLPWDSTPTESEMTTSDDAVALLVKQLLDDRDRSLAA
jgi:hypothetical protein